MAIDILVHEPSRGIWKNHSAFDIIGDSKTSVQTQGNSKVIYRGMIGHICYT